MQRVRFSRPTYPVVDTGQTQCYNNSDEIACPSAGQAFYGQDAQIVRNAPAYIWSNDGLAVYDNNTGLTWQQSHDSNADGPLNSADKLTWDKAQARPASLNASHYGGFNDWRLPAIKVLYSPIDFRGTDPSVGGSDTSGLTPFIDRTYFQFAYGRKATPSASATMSGWCARPQPTWYGHTSPSLCL
jgi:hypothetical protein